MQLFGCAGGEVRLVPTPSKGKAKRSALRPQQLPAGDGGYDRGVLCAASSTVCEPKIVE